MDYSSSNSCFCGMKVKVGKWVRPFDSALGASPVSLSPESLCFVLGVTATVKRSVPITSLWRKCCRGLWSSFCVELAAASTSWWRRQWHPTPVLLPGKSHGWRSLEGCRPWGRWGSDTTEWLHFHFSLSCIGEGNGNPLQYSCLRNPMDRGA